MRVGIMGVGGNRPIEPRQRFQFPAERQQRVAPVVEQWRVARPQRHRTIVARQRIGMALQREQRVAAVEQRQFLVAVQLERCVEQPHRFLRPVRLGEQRGEQCHRGRMPRAGRQHRAIGVLRVGQPTGLVPCDRLPEQRIRKRLRLWEPPAWRPVLRGAGRGGASWVRCWNNKTGQLHGPVLTRDSVRIASNCATKTALCSKRHMARMHRQPHRHPRASGDPSGIGPRFRGDDGVVGDACEPCGVCYIGTAQKEKAAGNDPAAQLVALVSERSEAEGDATHEHLLLHLVVQGGTGRCWRWSGSCSRPGSCSPRGTRPRVLLPGQGHRWRRGQDQPMCVASAGQADPGTCSRRSCHRSWTAVAGW